MNLWIVFLTGLTTGGLSCLAVQSGLLTSVIASSNGEEEKSEKTEWQKDIQKSLFPVGLFLGSKLIAHTVLGFFLGALGSVIALSLETRLLFQTFTAFFMFATAMNLLDVHPIFRWVVLQPPSFLRKYIRSKKQGRNWFSPIFLGALTVLIPCGVTQAMEITAIQSGSALQGALILFTFVLGTTPLFFLLGATTSQLLTHWKSTFEKVAATILILLSLWTLNGVFIVLESPLAAQKLFAPILQTNKKPSPQTSGVVMEDGVQKVHITVKNNGYSPKKVVVQSGFPVELTLESNETYSCAVDFVFPEFDIATLLQPTDKQAFVFTPQKPGTYGFSCSMGMYSGTIEVL